MSHALMQMARTQRSVFGCLRDAMLKKSLGVVGATYGVSTDVRCVLDRVLILYAPTYMRAMFIFDQSSSSMAQQLLFVMIQCEQGKIVMESSSMQIQPHSFFACMDDLLRYKEALSLEVSLAKLSTSKKTDDLVQITEIGQLALQKLAKCQESANEYCKPDWFVPYTPNYVYASTIWHSVQALNKLKQYNEANSRLTILLKQKCVSRLRGKWWERLALNLHSHLKKPQLALEAIEEALKDESVTENFRLTLIDRRDKIVEQKSRKRKCTEIEELWETVTISGAVLRKNLGYAVTQNLFLASDNASELSVCNVESVAISYYTKEQFEYGVHTEGRVWCAILCLLCWDEIFDPHVINVWVSFVQEDPLDLNHPLFYSNRSKTLDRRFKWICNASIQELCEKLTKTFESKHGTSTSLMSWDLFEDTQILKDIVKCVGGEKLSLILDYLARDIRNRKSGFPDLILYSPTKHRIKVSEVKGPGDVLSPKQIIWLNYFVSVGIPAEVCLVKAKM